MSEDLPKLSKSISAIAPTRKDLSARIRKAGAKTLVAALGLLGINVGASTSPAPAAEIAVAPAIVNRKEKTERGSVILQLASNFTSPISFLGHRSHRSHSSHRSHYSSSGGSSGSSGSTVTPKQTTPPVLAEDNSLLAGAEMLTGRITEVQSAKQYFILKDNAENSHTIYFAGTTKVHLLSPSDQTSTVDTLKAFMGSIPLKVGQSIMVHWKTIEAKKTALQITLFELPK
jgi:hypothetical protein